MNTESTPRTRPDEIPAHLVSALIPQNVAGARWSIAWLLRGFVRRLPRETNSQRNRAREFGRELADALMPLAVSQRSTLGFFEAVCNRWDVDPTGSDAGGPLEAWTPRGRLRWDRALSRVSIEHLRMVIHENPAFLAQFAVTWNDTEEEDGADDALLASFGTETHERTTPHVYVDPGSAATTVVPSSYRAVLTSTSEMHHGADEKHGNVALFRRKRVFDRVIGEYVMHPFVAGNSVRGGWRDLIMDRALSLVGLTTKDLAPSTAQSLFAGGTIKSGADTAKNNNALRWKLRELLPAWDLFAGCLDDQMMAGRLRVNDMIPACRETAWLVRDALAPGADMLAFRESLPAAQELTTLRLLNRLAHREFGESDDIQMLVNTELAVSGTQWIHSVRVGGLDGVSLVVQACLADLLEEFRETGAQVGAGGARGYGLHALSGYVRTGKYGALPPPDPYLEHCEKHRDAIRDLLTGLGRKAVAEGDADAGEPKSKPLGKKASKAIKAALDQRSAAEVTPPADDVPQGSLL